MTVLVSGASGYLGHHLVRTLAARGETVAALVRATSKTEHLAALAGDVRFIVDDGTLEGLAAAFGDMEIEVVYHLAACRPGRAGEFDAGAMIEANVLLGARLLEAAVGGGCKAFVNTGTYSQFGPEGECTPDSFYAVTKQAFQDILAGHESDDGFGAVTLIPYEIYGPGDWRDKFTSALCSAAGGNPVDMTAGEQIMDLVHVSDAADAFHTAGDLLCSGGIGVKRERFFLGSGHRASLKEIAQTFEAVCGRPLAINWGALDYRANQIFSPCAAEPRLPDWEPAISLEEGFAEIVREIDLSETA